MKALFGAVVKAMQAWGDDNRSERPFDPARKLNIGVLEDCSGDEYRVRSHNDRHRSAERKMTSTDAGTVSKTSSG